MSLSNLPYHQLPINISRFGKLCRGFRERWWHLSPYWLTANNLRASTTVLAGPIGDEIVEPTKGNSIVKYEYWTHTLPSIKPVIGLKRSLENARNDACIALNETIRPYVSNGLHLARPRPGRRWADARGLEFVHIDIANVLAEAMDTGIIRCMVQTLCVWALPPRLVWSSTLRGVQVRQEYAKVVENYRAQLRHIVASFPDIDSEARSKLEVSWGVKELHKTSPLLIQLLDESLSKHAFISPHAPIATLTGIASRLDTLYPLLPESGIARSICDLHARTILARLPDELWHGYATPAPPLPVSIPRATWRRAKDSPIFWVFFDIFIQWVVYFALIPVDGISGIWVVLIPVIDIWMRLPWYLKERKFWQKLWKVYDGGAVQGDGEAWVRDTSHSALQGRKLFYGGRAAGMLLETTEIGLESLRGD